MKNLCFALSILLLLFNACTNNSAPGEADIKVHINTDVQLTYIWYDVYADGEAVFSGDIQPYRESTFQQGDTLSIPLEDEQFEYSRSIEIGLTVYVGEEHVAFTPLTVYIEERVDVSLDERDIFAVAVHGDTFDKLAITLY